MRQTQLFTRTRKEAPKDEVSINAQLLIRAGFIHKEMAGVYSYLPLGLRVFNKIVNIIRQEMNVVGGQEMSMTALQDREIWEKTGRWNDELVDNWFKTTLKNGAELGLGFTHEEPITRIMKNYIFSYKDLPLYAYQIQTKFRNETRAKSGLMRGREFSMKDLYSFHKDEVDLDKYYEKVSKAYEIIFERVGIGEVTYKTFASGGTFSKYSHEFQTLSDAGEDLIYICDKCKLAINKEIINDQPNCPECGNTELREAKAVEAGNIFKLKTKYSAPFELKYKNQKGEELDVMMGCYGIGIDRLMGIIVETSYDNKGIIWPEEVAPFKAHLLNLAPQNEKLKDKADKLYHDLQKRNIEVLYDDREEATTGEKFADSDLMGIPYRLVVSEKAGDKIEIKKRNSQEISLVDESELMEMLK